MRAFFVDIKKPYVKGGNSDWDGRIDNWKSRKFLTEVMVRNANQIKSADPVTYDDNGEVIPLSRRFNADDADIRFRQPRSRVTQAEDAAYMNAVDAGDTATAARMIREAAAKAMPNVLKGEDGYP